MAGLGWDSVPCYLDSFYTKELTQQNLVRVLGWESINKVQKWEIRVPFMGRQERSNRKFGTEWVRVTSACVGVGHRGDEVRS